MECWLASQSDDPHIREENDWAFMEPTNEAKGNPEKAWEYIFLAVNDERFSILHLGTLAAGALEGLLSFHGQEYINKVELLAKRNKRFSIMLGAVWQFQMDDAIWQKVQELGDFQYWKE